MPEPRRPTPRSPVSAVTDPMATSRAKLAEFEKGLVINKRDYDGELSRHSERYYHTGKEHALAKSYMEQAKADMKEARAACNIALRDAAKQASVRITEDELDARISVDARVIAATKRYHDWIFLEAAWLSLTISVYERRPAMENMIKLDLAQLGGNGVGATGKLADDLTARRVRQSGD